MVFDPTVLAGEYGETCSLVAFVASNYAPLQSGKHQTQISSVLAFCALLLFVNEWNMS